jgi:hypothetical protein
VEPPADVFRIACSRSEALSVKGAAMVTRLSKSMISARSCGHSRLTKPIAASWAVGNLVSMLASVDIAPARSAGWSC